jgi:hypothetical protein
MYRLCKQENTVPVRALITVLVTQAVFRRWQHMPSRLVRILLATWFGSYDQDAVSSDCASLQLVMTWHHSGHCVCLWFTRFLKCKPAVFDDAYLCCRAEGVWKGPHVKGRRMPQQGPWLSLNPSRGSWQRGREPRARSVGKEEKPFPAGCGGS